MEPDMVVPEKAVLRASRWCYQGIWAVLTGWMLVPDQPPRILGADDLDIRSFRPSEGFLRYLKLFFWIGLTVVDIALVIAWIAIGIWNPIVGLLITPLALAIIILPDIVAYIAIHLRYDTTWYVLSDRSMRIRRGIWSIRESTITYDNIQNVSVRQGPVQRFYGIADVLVETAGGGASTGQGEGGTVVGHHGLLEGIDNAQEVRNLILAKWRLSADSGLGDRAQQNFPSVGSHKNRSGHGFSHSEILLLEQIRDVAIQLTATK